MLSDVCLSDICCVHPVGGRPVQPTGGMTCIGWSGSAWLKAAAARFHCRRGRVISWRPPAYSLLILLLSLQLHFVSGVRDLYLLCRLMWRILSSSVWTKAISRKSGSHSQDFRKVLIIRKNCGRRLEPVDNMSLRHIVSAVVFQHISILLLTAARLFKRCLF